MTRRLGFTVGYIFNRRYCDYDISDDLFAAQPTEFDIARGIHEHMMYTADDRWFFSSATLT